MHHSVAYTIFSFSKIEIVLYNQLYSSNKFDSFTVFAVKKSAQIQSCSFVSIPVLVFSRSYCT